MILWYTIWISCCILSLALSAQEHSSNWSSMNTTDNNNSSLLNDFSIIATLPSLQYPFESLYKNSVILNLSIPPITGLVMSPFYDSDVDGGSGRHLWVGRVQHSILSIRPSWLAVYGFDDILSIKNCVGIIDDAEKFARSRIDPVDPESTGWLTDRHPNHATTDLPVRSIYGDDRLHNYLTDILLPHFTTIYGVDASSLYIADLFIVKYTGGATGSGQSFLDSHRDRSPFSFVVSLNDAFVGGGTFFPQLDQLWKPKTGGAVLFHGQSLHGGAKVISGLRYIIAGFVEYNDEFDSNDKEISGEQKFTAFMKNYIPEYDGMAAAYGFRSGDVVRGIEACYLSDTVASISNVSALEVEVDGEANGELERDNRNHATRSGVNRISRNLVALDINAISTQLWRTIASSCEVLEPDANTNLIIERKDIIVRSERTLDY